MTTNTEPRSGRRLLVIPCSKEKSDIATAIPAIERYRGRVFSVIQNVRSSSAALENVDILILSAKYGLISESELILLYDQRMNPVLAAQHQALACRLLQDAVGQRAYLDCFVLLEPDYLEVVRQAKFPSKTSFETEISERTLKALSDWLLNPGA